MNVKAKLSPDDLARACAAAMWKEDGASQGLGMDILVVKAGEAVLAMTIQPHMVNGHGIAHGGFIFTLADSAFAFACNSHSQRHVAQHCQIVRSVAHAGSVQILVHHHVQPPVSAAADFRRPSVDEPPR